MCDTKHRFSVRRLSVQTFGGVNHVASQHGEAIHHVLGALCPSYRLMALSSSFCIRDNVSLTSSNLNCYTMLQRRPRLRELLFVPRLCLILFHMVLNVRRSLNSLRRKWWLIPRNSQHPRRKQERARWATSGADRDWSPSLQTMRYSSCLR